MTDDLGNAYAAHTRCGFPAAGWTTLDFDPERHAMKHNKFGIGPIDHFSLPCRDPAFSATFYESLLGAKIYEDENGRRSVFGISAEDKALGRSIHIFMEMECGQMFELLEHDLKGTPPAGTHHAFQIGPNDVDSVQGHLDALGIPYMGPATHAGSKAVSFYFQDPDGNVLEFCCFSGFPRLADVPLSQHMKRRSLDYVWDQETKTAKPPAGR